MPCLQISKIIFLAAFGLIFCAEFSLAQEEQSVVAEVVEPQKAEEKTEEKVEEAKPQEAPQQEVKKEETKPEAKKAVKTVKKLRYRYKPKPKPKVTEIPYEFLLHINLTQEECEKFVGGECLRRDKMRDEPYYHKTKLTIFRDKIFAEQFFKGEDRVVDKLFLSVNDGDYELETNNDNLISFTVKSSAVSELKLQKGDLEKEKESNSQCRISEIIYGFYQASDPKNKLAGIIEKTVLTKDEYNFDGFKEITFFVEKNRQADVMVITKNSNQTPVAIKDLRLCKMPDFSETPVYFVKHVSDEGCKANRHENVAECAKYMECQDYLVVKDCDTLMLRDPM